MRQVRKMLLAAGLALCGLPVLAQTAEDTCDRKARRESGLRSQSPPLQAQSGNTTIRLGGSAGFGVSRSGGGAPSAAAPPFAGQASVEWRRRKAEKKYLEIYRECIGLP